MSRHIEIKDEKTGTALTGEADGRPARLEHPGCQEASSADPISSQQNGNACGTLQGFVRGRDLIPT
jgi:hypothetical protein